MHSQRRITQLDGIRALAIGLVFLNHAYHVPLTWMGVDLFFILSGFLITNILLRRKSEGIGTYFKVFYERRARRILPSYLLLLLVVSLVTGAWYWLRHGYMFLFAMNLVDVLRVPRPEEFSILWSLAVEEQFYMVWPFVVFFCSEKTVGRIAGLIVVSTPLLRYVCTPLFDNNFWIYKLTPFRADLIAIGALLSIIWRKRHGWIEHWGRYGLALSILGVVLMVLCARKIPNFNTSANTAIGNALIYEFCLLICFGIIVWALSGWRVDVLRLAPVQYLGRTSYTVYLFHVMFLLLMEKHIANHHLAVGCSVVLTLAWSAASWHWMEAPILRSGYRERVDG